MSRCRTEGGFIPLVLCLGCVPAMGEGRSDGTPDDGAPPTEAAASRVAPEPEGLFEVVFDGQAPSAPPMSLTGSGHAEHVGWTSDGENFAHCRDRADADCYECQWVAHDGSVQSLESGPGCAQGVPRAQLDARLAKDHLEPGPARWRWGSDVVLVVESREEEVTNAGRPRPMLKLGAQSREGGVPAWVLHVDPCQGCGTDQVCDGQAHLDALTLSPDGRDVVALVHGRGNDGSESMRMERLPAQRLAQAALTPASHAVP